MKMEDTNEVGLDSNRIQNRFEVNLENMTCALCEKILWKPVYCGVCKGRFCSLCVLRWLDEREDASPTRTDRWIRRERYTHRMEAERWFEEYPARCPMGCESFIRGLYFLDANNPLSNLRVSCIYAPHNCPEILAYDSVEAHEQHCGYRPLNCSGCRQLFAAKDIAQHEFECGQIQLICKYCNISYERRDANESHTDMICLNEQLRKIQLESHTAMKTLEEELRTLREAYQVLAFRLNQSTVVSPTATQQATTLQPAYRNAKIEGIMRQDARRQYLSLRHENLIDDDMQLVASHAIINNAMHTSIDVGINLIQDQGVKYITDVLPMSLTLTKLTFYCNKIGDLGAEYLANALKNSMVKLTELNLGDNKIEPEGAKHLANGLKISKTLISLEICRNKIKDEGAQYLSEALQQNTTLTKLDVGCNGIEEQGAHYIATALAKNTKLSVLYLYGNLIGHQGVLHIANVLRNNTTLTDLNLSENNIGSTGAQHFAHALESNMALKELSIHTNRIGDRGIQYMADALRSNQTLVKLTAWGNEIGDQGVQYLANALSQNQTLQRVFVLPSEISPALKKQLRQQEQRIA